MTNKHQNLLNDLYKFLNVDIRMHAISFDSDEDFEKACDACEDLTKRLDAFLADVPIEDKTGVGYDRVNNQHDYLCRCAELLHTATTKKD